MGGGEGRKDMGGSNSNNARSRFVTQPAAAGRGILEEGFTVDSAFLKIHGLVCIEAQGVICIEAEVGTSSAWRWVMVT